MLKFAPHLKENVERRRQDLAASPSRTGVMSVRTWMLGDQRSRGDLNGHQAESDEDTTYGGSDAAPRPLAYLLAALGFCEQTMISRWASDRELQLEDVQIETKGYWDRKGGHVEGFEPTGFGRFTVRVEVQSPEDADTIREMMENVERQCYVVNTFKRCARVEHTLIHNGDEIMATVVGESPSDAP
ncbi:MAG: hypothetical protein GEU93_00730 [Propionibacteriales bacterium]|nr:hypothetical protein [Propionibacteriales bacterium]